MRRPRIKVTANLVGSKRKPKNNVANTTGNLEVSECTTNSNEQIFPDEQINKEVNSDDKRIIENNSTHELDLNNKEPENLQPEVTTINENVVATNPGDVDESHSEKNLDVCPTPPQFQDSSFKAKDYVINEPSKGDDANVESSFKCPPNVVGYNRNNSYNLGNTNVNTKNDDGFHSDLEDLNVIQMDLIKSSQTSTNPVAPTSPSKTVARQRIRPTPIFGQRRNSFMAMSPSPHTADESSDLSAPLSYRRERHFSGSLSQASNSSLPHHPHTPHKYVPIMGRTRTESGCSAFSDTYAASIKSRKGDDYHQHHRAMSRREHEARFSNGVVPDKSTLKMFDLIYYNPVTNPMDRNVVTTNDNDEPSNGDDANSTAKQSNPKSGDANAAATLPVPQLKLNSNGELILDHKSLLIETTAEQEARKVLASSALIYVDENSSMSGFYKKQKRTREWPAKETVKFYRCLQIIGTDFSLIGQLFPNRSRRDLKLKFKKEERCNLALVNKALLHPKTFNIDELQKQLETEERERMVTERKWKEIRAKKTKKMKKLQAHIKAKASAGGRALADADIVYYKEKVIKNRIKFHRRKRKSLNCESTPADIPQMSSEDPLMELAPKKKHKRLRRKKAKNKNSCDKANVACNDEDVNKQEENTHHHHRESGEATIAAIDHHQLEQELADLLIQSNETFQEMPTNGYNDSYMESSITLAPEFPIIEENRNLDEMESLNNCNDVNNAFVCDETIVPNDEYADEVYAEQSDSITLHDMDETYIQQILIELAEGTMALVSTQDPINLDRVLNEIYALDKTTGELCREPLKIPEAIVECILSEMS